MDAWVCSIFFHVCACVVVLFFVSRSGYDLTKETPKPAADETEERIDEPNDDWPRWDSLCFSSISLIFLF
jgi:hypothetical protein